MNRERKASEKSRKRRIHSMHNRHIDREQLQVSLGVWMIRKLIDWVSECKRNFTNRETWGLNYRTLKSQKRDISSTHSSYPRVSDQ